VEPLENTEITYEIKSQNRFVYEFLKDDGDAYKVYGVKALNKENQNAVN
jgi:hypothetical protein